MGYDDRPAADPAGLRAQLASWQSGSELPGRTLSNLKTGRLDEVIEALAADDRAPQALLDAWESWEKGKGDPAEVLAAMTDAGLPAILDQLASV